MIIILSTIICFLLLLEFRHFIRSASLKEKLAFTEDALDLSVISWMNERISNSSEEEKNRLEKILKLGPLITSQELLHPGSVNLNNISQKDLI